ncbi:UNVERIFIED_CONTAM: Splicing factor-like protein 1 [Sesamum latifolium]|uniref:Splicing factor-like protein 1 n=1 Tax=Sesamum latifolium TaxID=2727402 RepID=A0AAW2Y2C9_9LAMI
MAKACLQSKMGTEVEHASGNMQTNVTTSSSTASTGPKSSMFAKKSGFVIPKNKLSGSLVPVFRGTKKGDADLVNEDATNQVQRKTKWGPDLTLDATVRKGRALAYQTRINQISQQLTLGTLELEDDEDSLPTSEFQSGKRSDHQLSHEESEQLDLERREIIGEILKLNPTYKAPADYKPLLKEAKVPIPDLHFVKQMNDATGSALNSLAGPVCKTKSLFLKTACVNLYLQVKEYPGYNFIGLVYGPASDTQKRLEKETGAKIRVYGAKADTGGKVEVAPTDGKEIDNAYEDLYVHVSADTFEKVDAAVALIELLVTPVSVNPMSASATSTAVSDDNVNTHLSQSTPSSIMAPALIKQGTAQPFAGSLPPPQGQFPQYPQTWFPAGPTQTPTHPQSGLVTPANSSAPLLNNTVQVSSSPFNPSNMPSFFGSRPVIAASFSPVLQNPSVVPPRSQLPHPVQPPYMQQPSPLGQTGAPRNTPVPILQPATGQLSRTGLLHNVRPDISAMPQSAPPAAFSDKTFPSVNESSRWLPSPGNNSASQGLTNVMPMTPQVVPSHGHNAVASQNMVVSGPSPLNIHSNILTGPSQSAGGVGIQQPRGGFSPLLPSAASESLSMRPQTVNGIPGPATLPFPVQSSASLPQPGIPNSFSGSAQNFDSMRPLSAAIPRPQQPSSSDFTFQPHRPPNAASQVAWQSGQPAHQNMRPPVQAGQAPLATQSSLLWPGGHNLNPSPVQGFPRSQMSHQVNQPRVPIPTNFSGSPMPPRHPTLPGHSGVASATVPHMQPRNFVPPHPINSTPGPFPPRPGSQMHILENHLPGAPRPQRFPTPHQHLGNHPGRPFSSSSGVQQIYDPFSPTAVSFNPQMGSNAARVHGESDPEYEDLMASVGVK